MLPGNSGKVTSSTTSGPRGGGKADPPHPTKNKSGPAARFRRGGWWDASEPARRWLCGAEAARGGVFTLGYESGEKHRTSQPLATASLPAPLAAANVSFPPPLHLPCYNFARAAKGFGLSPFFCFVGLRSVRHLRIKTEARAASPVNASKASPRFAPGGVFLLRLLALSSSSAAVISGLSSTVYHTSSSSPGPIGCNNER